MTSPDPSNDIHQTVRRRVARIGPHQAVHTLTLSLSRELGVSRRAIRKALKELLSQGVISFTYRLGTSFIEPSFQRPVRLASRVWIAPPETTAPCQPGEVVVRIAAGDAFGDGRHPTTRLALGGIEYAWELLQETHAASPARSLDVGTGSGILALAALALGIDEAWGVDIDACARIEARTNARINNVADRFRINADLKELAPRPFRIISANLRLPTLGEMAPVWHRYSDVNTKLILTGVRTAETDALISIHNSVGWCAKWTQAEDGWAVVVFDRK